MKKTTAAITLVGSFLVLGLIATAHSSGRGSGYERGSGYYDRGSRYEYNRGSSYEYRGGDRGSRYEYRNGRYSDDRYEYRNGRYSDDDRYEYRRR